MLGFLAILRILQLVSTVSEVLNMKLAKPVTHQSPVDVYCFLPMDQTLPHGIVRARS